jgi:hypothetical protein
MTDSNSDRRFVPQGWHSVTPRIVVHGAKEFVRPRQRWGFLSSSPLMLPLISLGVSRFARYRRNKP